MGMERGLKRVVLADGYSEIELLIRDERDLDEQLRALGLNLSPQAPPHAGMSPVCEPSMPAAAGLVRLLAQQIPVHKRCAPVKGGGEALEER